MLTSLDVEIFTRIIDPTNPTLKPDAARAILELSYGSEDRLRIAELARKSNEGTLTSQERELLSSYVSVGDLFSLMKSKARLSLAKHSSAA